MKCKVDSCSFFGTEATNGYCSTCYKIHGVVSGTADKELHESKPKVVNNSERTSRCNHIGCSRKLKKFSLEASEPCVCGNYYCADHRYPENHYCTYNYKKEHKDHLSSSVVDARFSKVDKI